MRQSLSKYYLKQQTSEILENKVERGKSFLKSDQKMDRYNPLASSIACTVSDCKKYGIWTH